ncbi:MAG: hypothetical protein NW208_03210 [Bryobacter sp.]|nr:hypothetical protein [Bryobacter sp.]
MKYLIACLLLLADPFWVAAPPEQWNEEQLEQFFSESPWARPAEAVAVRGQAADKVRTFLATSAPMRLAEQEWRRRRLPKEQREGDDAWAEWEEFLAKSGSRYVVLAVAIPQAGAADGREMAEMEQQSVLRTGRQKYKLNGYFPATERDPYTRLIFPRPPLAKAKELVFELYLPGANGGHFREALYLVKELNWQGEASF